MRNKILALTLSFTALVAFVSPAQAFHSWNGYHWARTSNPFSLRLGNNLTGDWSTYLNTAAADWSASSVLDTVVVPGGTKSKVCKATAGRVEVCNATYGRNGWLGLAQVWVSGGHITQGLVKMNDTYMSKPPYNTPAEKNHVMCQEVGHTLGLGHQDESGLALGTCMDYSTSVNSQHPNQHDYDELANIYAHLDGFSTVNTTTVTSSANGDNWGRRVFRSRSGHLEVHERDLGNNQKLISFVVLAHH